MQRLLSSIILPSEVIPFDYVGTQFQLGWEAIQDDIMPLELLLDQLPGRLMVRNTTLQLHYQPILDPGGSLHKVLVVLSDISAQLQHEQAELEKAEILAVFERVLASRTVFNDFVVEAEKLVMALTGTIEAPLHLVKRHLHTLKGSCGIYGLKTISALCHDLETRMAEHRGGLSPTDKTELMRCWQRVSEKIERFTRPDAERRVEVDEAELLELRRQVESGLERGSICESIAQLTLQPTRVRLDHFAEYAVDLSRRLGA